MFLNLNYFCKLIYVYPYHCNKTTTYVLATYSGFKKGEGNTVCMLIVLKPVFSCRAIIYWTAVWALQVTLFLFLLHSQFTQQRSQQ